VGGPADIQAKKGDVVRFVVSSDAADDIHLHGYDIEKKVEPGQPARFKFTADVEGIFEIESHVAEDAGKDPLVGKLTVEPS
jgi:plastocyanin